MLVYHMIDLYINMLSYYTFNIGCLCKTIFSVMIFIHKFSKNFTEHNNCSGRTETNFPLVCVPKCLEIQNFT